MERIGFIGLGNMGKPIAENLARAGFPMTKLDLNPAPVADLASLGAAVGITPSEVAASSEIICSVVMNDQQTEAVFLQDDGVFAGVAR
ncbi:MAG: NAD(P)-binding domain-containing protein [Pseudomonadota bacterium]|nr:NAD(P)-binding domain-containing protein [Pseudomonadota bacterium]